jgi:hypothetical protein
VSCCTPFLMKKWVENIKDALLNSVEVFVNEIIYEWRKNVSPAKLMMGAVVLIIAGGFIISNYLESEEKVNAPVKNSDPAPLENQSSKSGTNIDDKAVAMQVAKDFIKEYSTYKPREPLAEKVKPYVTEPFYVDQQEADRQARPTFEVYESKVLSVDKGFIEPMGDDLYWTGSVELETTNAAGEKAKEKLFYAVTLTQLDGWRVREVEVLDDPNL